MIPRIKRKFKYILRTEHVLVEQHYGQQKQLHFGVKKFLPIESETVTDMDISEHVGY